MRGKPRCVDLRLQTHWQRCFVTHLLECEAGANFFNTPNGRQLVEDEAL